MKESLTWLKHEFQEAIPPFLFFFAAFHLVAVLRALLQQQYGIQTGDIMGATIAALIVAKVVLLADHLPMVNRFPDKPLVYNILWKTFIYQAVAIFAVYLEHFWHAYREVGTIAAASTLMIDSVVWPHFWAVQLLMLVLFLQYCTLREFTRAVGSSKVRALFLGPLPDTTQ